MSTLIVRTVLVVLTNLIPLDGVLRLGWNAVPLVLIFILESLAILFTDAVKVFFDRGPKNIRGVFVFECVFILFYGVFAILVFGPYDSLQSAVDDGFRRLGKLIAGELLQPLAALFFLRLVRLGQDLAAAGLFGGKVRRPLQLDGGARMFLLFLAVILAPLIARSGPNPTGGLAALVTLKTMGEVIMTWSVRIRAPKPIGKSNHDRRKQE